MKLRCRDDTVPKTVDTRSHCKVWLRACNNLPQPQKTEMLGGGCGRLLHALNHTLQWLLVSTVFGTVSSLHLNFIFNDFYTCFTHFSLTVSISTNRGLPSLDYLPGYRSRVPYVYAHALDLSAKIRMREIELVICKWRRILRKLPDLAKSLSERYKLSVCIKGSCATCIQAPLYNFYGL